MKKLIGILLIFASFQGYGQYTIGGTVTKVDTLGQLPASDYATKENVDTAKENIRTKYDSANQNRLSGIAANTASIATKQNLLNVSSNYLVRSTVSGYFNSLIQDDALGVGIGTAPSIYAALTINPRSLTVANKNKNSVLVGNSTGSLRMYTQDSVWNGSAYVVAVNTGFGFNSLYDNTAANVTAFGYQSASNNTGIYGTGMGHQSIMSNTGIYVTGLGYQSARSNTGNFVSGFGGTSAISNTGSQVNLFGYAAGSSNTGSNSNGMGGFALSSNTGTNSNTLGHIGLQFNTGTFALGLGDEAMVYNVADSTIGVGSLVLKNNNSKNRIGIGGTKYANTITSAAVTQNFASANVTGTTITITAHGFGTVGTKVNLLYTVLTGTTVGGLTNARFYQFTITSANVLTLSTITSAGSGTYSLSKDVDKSNSGFIGNNIDNTKADQFIIGGFGNKEVKLNGALKIDSFAHRVFVVEGDSYSNDSNDWPYALDDSLPYFGKARQVNYAVAGNTTAQMKTQYSTEAHLNRPATVGDDFWFIMYAGINDLNGGISADSVFKNLKYLWGQARNDGFKVVAFTVIHSTALSAPNEAARVALNDSIKNNPQLYDYVIDVAKVFDPRIDASVFADATHLTPAGALKFAGVVARTISHIPYSLTPASGISTSPLQFDVNFKGKVSSPQYKLSALNTAPSSATDTGTLGEVRITASYIYVCTATNTWVRTALSTW